MSSQRETDPARILSELARHKVAFVVIGGIAAALQGSPSNTFDLDVCYSRESENLVRLIAALRALNARLRVARDNSPLPFRLDPRTLRAGNSFTFETDAGPFDILGTPAGTTGYAELAASAVPLWLDGLKTLVASVDSLISMKRAAGRPKDRAELEILYALREELEAARAELRTMLETFVNGQNTSKKFVQAIEDSLAEHFRGIDEFESLRECCARYEPGGSEFLYDEAGLRSTFQEALATFLHPGSAA